MLTSNPKSQQHAMTCDVEDYFPVSAFADVISQASWADLDCRIPRNMDRILGLLDAHDVTATFFTLGWVAERFPQLIRRVADSGHEIASHGMVHTRVWSQSRAEFAEDAATSRKLLEDVAGQRVVGYRAASWSIDGRTPWAHEVLAEAGYAYSSSIYPIAHDHFGMPDAPRLPYRVADDALLEIPASTARMFGRNWPAAGGGFFRLYPVALSKYLIRQHQAAADCPYIFYFHPWELDPEQPRVDGISSRARFKHYLNLDRFESRFVDMLGSFDWGRMDELFLPGTAS